jgi:hypothetical protein
MPIQFRKQSVSRRKYKKQSTKKAVTIKPSTKKPIKKVVVKRAVYTTKPKEIIIKDVYNVREKFINNQAEMIKKEDLYDYTEEDFRKNLEHYLSRYGYNPKWRYDQDELTNIYNDIIDKASKLVRARRNLKDDVEKKINDDFNDMNKQDKQFSAKLKNKYGFDAKELRNYALEKRLTRKYDETLVKYMNRLIEVYVYNDDFLNELIDEIGLNDVIDEESGKIIEKEGNDFNEEKMKEKKEQQDIADKKTEIKNIIASAPPTVFASYAKKNKLSKANGNNLKARVSYYAIQNLRMPEDGEDDDDYVLRMLDEFTSNLAKSNPSTPVKKQASAPDPELAPSPTPVPVQNDEDLIKEYEDQMQNLDKEIAKLENEVKSRGETIQKLEDDYMSTIDPDELRKIRNEVDTQKKLAEDTIAEGMKLQKRYIALNDEVEKLKNKSGNGRRRRTHYKGMRKQPTLYGKGLFSNIRNFFKNDTSQQTEKMVKQYGDWNITELRIHRTPVEKVLQSVMNAVSSGKWNEMKNKYQYDDIYHLYLYLKLQSSDGKVKYFMTEKSPNIGWSERSSLHSDSSKGNNLNLSVRPISFKDVIDKTKQKMGVNFSRYDAINNCQQYILNLVLSIYELNGEVLPSEIHNFIWQNAEPLLNDTSKQTANFVTGLSHGINRLLGKGRRTRRTRRMRGGAGDDGSSGNDIGETVGNIAEAASPIIESVAPELAPIVPLIGPIVGAISSLIPTSHMQYASATISPEERAWAQQNPQEAQAQLSQMFASMKGHGKRKAKINLKKNKVKYI